MRIRVIVPLALCLLGGVVRADEATPVAPADRAAIQQVIQTQLEAFRRDDGPGAFAEASPGIQAQFGGDPAAFMDMVRRGYQPVYRPQTTAFGPVVGRDGHVVQTLDITGPDGGGHQALYFMEHETDGTWRISGCVLTDKGTVGA